VAVAVAVVVVVAVEGPVAEVRALQLAQVLEQAYP
jgi:hypothetical protein